MSRSSIKEGGVHRQIVLAAIIPFFSARVFANEWLSVYAEVLREVTDAIFEKFCIMHYPPNFAQAFQHGVD